MAATLLLADNSVTIQRVVALSFADESIDVVACGSGESAIASIERVLPDIVLAAADLPGTSGYDLARYIKQSPRLAHIPVLLLAGAFDPIDQHQADQVGCDGVLTKPFEPQFVVRRVKELLARSRVDLAASEAVPAAPASSGPRSEPPRAWSSDRPAGAAPTAATSVDQFFDQLDAAFASLPRTRPPVPVSSDEAGDQDEGASEHNRSIVSLPQDGVDRPVADGRPGAGDLLPTTELLSPSPPSAGHASRDVTPTLADAFAALLLAEQHPGSSPALDAWWAPQPVVTDDLVERVTERVLARLSDQVVRETVAHLVSERAERLIREEIERIKAAMK